MDPFKARLFPKIQKLYGNSENLQKVHVEHGVFRSLNLARPTQTFAPVHYEQNYAYPLIVWLHGSGLNENQLMQVMPQISLRNYMGISVRGSVAYDENGVQKPGFYWTRESYDTAATAVLESLESVQKQYRISTQRVYLAGSGEAGSMALRIAFKNPTFFAGVVSLDGPVPDESMIFEHLKDLREMRIMLGLSRQPERYPVEAVCEDLRRMHAAGLMVAVRNYPTAGSLQLDMLRDVDRWIMGSFETGLM